MPIGCDTQQTFAVILDGDKEKSPTPCFFVRYLSKRAWPAAVALHDVTFDRKEKTPAQVSMEISAALAPLVVGWANIKGQFSLDALDDVLMIHEAVELLDKAWRGQRPTAEDKKKLDSPSGSVTDSPAAVVPG